MLFYYKRETKREVLLEEKNEDGTPKKDVITEVLWDCINTDKIVRGVWTTPIQFMLMLDDGHEQAEDLEKPKYNAKRQVVGVEVKRERAWYVTQVTLDKEDAERLREISRKGEIVLEKMIE